MLMHLKSKLLLSVVESHKRFTRYKGIGAVPYLRSRQYTLHEIAHGHLIRAFPVWVMWPMRMHSRGHIHELKKTNQDYIILLENKWQKNTLASVT